MYFVLVRSILEYKSPIWNPYSKTYFGIIERIQNWFLKFIAFKFNLPINNYDYTKIRSSLNILTLFFRRKLADITFIHKLINVVTDAPDFLSCILFNISAYNNRSTPLFYIQIYSKNYLKNSPILRALTFCNELSKWVHFFFLPLREVLNAHMNNLSM